MKYVMSWEKPIELEILDYVKSMRRQMETVAAHGQEEVRESAENYAKAYATVEGHIVNEIEFRKKVKIL